MTTSMDDDDDIVDLTQTSDKQPVSSVCRHGIGQGVIDLCSPSPVSKKPPAVSDSHQNEDSYALIIDEDSNSSSNSASSTGLSLLSKLNLKYATAERSTSSTSLDNTRSKRSRLRSKTTEASIIDLDDSKMSEDDDVVHSTQLTAPSLLQHVLAVTSLASQANNTPTEKPVAGPTITTSAKPTGSSAAPKKQALITSFITSTAPVATSGPLTVNPEDFEVVLLIDRREKAHDAVMAGLLGEQVPCALCTLAVGDFLWVARPKANVSDESSDDMAWLRRGDELLVLDCIAERKALGDLASSLCDGRYRDQKTRIKSTQISQCFYIVEADQMVLPAQNKAISIDHIKNAMIATYVSSTSLYLSLPLL